MHRRNKAALAALMVAACHAAPAQAEEICRTASSGSSSLTACFSADAGISRTTMSPTVRFDCWGDLTNVCSKWVYDPIAYAVAKTGIEVHPGAATPEVDPATGSVRFGGGAVGTLWLNGVATPINVREFCVGSPSYCG